MSMPYKHQLLIEERENVITIIPWSSLCILFYVKCMSTSSFLKSRHHHHCALKTFWVCMCSSTRWVKVMNIYSFHRHFMTPVSTTLGNENERTYMYVYWKDDKKNLGDHFNLILMIDERRKRKRHLLIYFKQNVWQAKIY